MSEVIMNPVPTKKTTNGVRTSAVQDFWLQYYLLLFLGTKHSGGIPKSQCYCNVHSYRSFSQRWWPFCIQLSGSCIEMTEVMHL
jgi:hypothetical protein